MYVISFPVCKTRILLHEVGMGECWEFWLVGSTEQLNIYIYTRVSVTLLSLLFPEQLSRLTPKDCPHLLLQAIAGPLAAATASTLTNPMDVIRARVQVRAQHKGRVV